MAPYLRYLCALCGTILIPTLVVVGVNYRIGAIGWANPEIAAAAMRWQHATHGIVNIAVPQEHNFKLLSFSRRASEFDTVILGASTIQSLRAAALAPRRAYNYATSANETSAVVGEAEYFADRLPEGAWLVVSLDWALGYIYREVAPSPASSVAEMRFVPLAAQLADTLTLARVIGFTNIIARWVQASAPGEAVARTLTSSIDGPYRCPDEALGEDFAASDPNSCNGFRWDGSMTFLAQQPYSEAQYGVALALALQRNSEYVRSAVSHRGVPNPIYLQRLAQVAAKLRERGGRLVVVLPPLMPGLERALERGADTAPYVRQTKQVILGWAAANDITVIDAGASEAFGCEFKEFFDGHHNFGDCYEKIFAGVGQDQLEIGLHVRR